MDTISQHIGAAAEWNDQIPELSQALNNLSQVPNLRVMARTTSFAYKGKDFDPIEVGKRLNVRGVLTGKVNMLSNRLIVQADLIDASNGAQIWGEQFARAPADIFSLQEEIARGIAAQLRMKLSGTDASSIVERSTEDAEAYKLFLKGRYFFYQYQEESLRKGIEYLSQAIDRDPLFVKAYAGVSHSYQRLGLIYWRPEDAFPKARSFLQKAQEIDPYLGDTHLAAGGIYLFYDWNWDAAGEKLRRGVESIPQNSGAHLLYAYYLQATGRLTEATDEVKEAIELDPLSPLANADMAWAFIVSGQYDKAVEQCGKTLEIEPQWSPARVNQAVALAKKGELREAEDAVRQLGVSSQGPQILGLSGYVMGMAGNASEARTILGQLLQMSNKQYVSPVFVACVYAGTGERDLALEWLEKAYADRSPHMVWLKVNPVFEQLRPEPRFKDLLRRMKLS